MDVHHVRCGRTQRDAAAGRVPLEESRGAPVAVGQVRHHEAAAHLRTRVLWLLSVAPGGGRAADSARAASLDCTALHCPVVLFGPPY